MEKPIERDSLFIQLSHLLEDEESAHVVDFEDILVIDVFFVSDLLWNGDSALHTYSDSILRHADYLQNVLLWFFIM